MVNHLSIHKNPNQFSKKQYNLDMTTNRQFKIPDEISNDDELKAWYEQELEKLGDEPTPRRELALLETANRVYCRLKTDRNTPNPYKGPLVSALMESGWEIKRGSPKSKTLRQDASSLFTRALRFIPENPKACYRLGHLMKSREKFGEAIGYFSKALELASKQTDFQEDLKLSPAQIENARGQSIALLQKLSAHFEFYYEFTFEPEQIATLQNLLRETIYSHVVYSTKVERSITTKTIDSFEYDDRIREFKKDPKALVVDRYNQIPLLKFLDNQKSYAYDTPGSGKLNYLLKAMGLEDWEPSSVKRNTITQNVRRVNEDLKEIGVEKWVEINYSRADGGNLLARCDLTVHYFKSLLD
jgi:tetratricopeptide (TPR) repeat protein